MVTALQVSFLPYGLYGVQKRNLNNIYRSWYKNGAIDGDPQLWCGSALTYVKTIKAPRFEHYEIDYESVNPWAFLGNGKVKAHYDIVDGKPKYEGLAPYIRSDDAPWEI